MFAAREDGLRSVKVLTYSPEQWLASFVTSFEPSGSAAANWPFIREVFEWDGTKYASVSFPPDGKSSPSANWPARTTGRRRGRHSPYRSGHGLAARPL